MSIYWPDALRPQSIKVDLAHRSLRGPAAGSGFTQVVSNSAGIWQATFDSIPVYSSTMIRLWRALDAQIEGQLGVISIPVWDFPRSPSAADELGLNIYNLPQAPHSDGAFLSDSSGYKTAWTNILVGDNASIGATTVVLTKNAPYVTLEPGHRFSINDRLYQIKSITSQSDTQAEVIVRPPLREAITIGNIAEFDFPRLQVRLTDDKAMQISLDYNAKCFPTISFYEAV